MELKILVLPPFHWGFLWQRTQQIVSRLARDGHRILYLQSTHLDLAGIVWTLKRNMFLKRKIAGRLSLINLFLPPFYGKLEHVCAYAQLKFYLGILRFKPDVTIFCGTHYVFLLDTLKTMGTKIMYDCADEMSGFCDLADVARILQEEKDLAANSSIIIATSRALCQKLSRLNSNCVYVPNGADVAHFLKATKDSGKILEVEHLRHPIIGFIGAIFDWFDVELVCRLAELHPEYSILLVGPVNYGLEKFKQHPNITSLGYRKYEVLPKYLHYMDVCLIPFKINKLTLASNPIKMYEYLAAGKPVVSTALPEVCYNACGLVYIGEDDEDFIRKVEEAVDEPKKTGNETLIERRVRFAQDNSWEKRVSMLERLLRSLCVSD